ncbi:MAG: hypothetical protein R3Y12_00215 [Clostridia bacterium]
MLDLIIEKISEKYPESNIFNEKVKQNYDENCFIVWENKCEMQKFLKNRYLAIYEFSVFYYSEDDLTKIAEELCEVLCDLGEYKSLDLNYEIDQNTLEIKVSYQTFLIKEEEKSQNMIKFGVQFKM